MSERTFFANGIEGRHADQPLAVVRLFGARIPALTHFNLRHIPQSYSSH
jgi:hypothetical protein